MHILGVSCFYHDSAAAMLRDGEVIAAAEEERFTRKKHDYGFPDHAIHFCLDQAGITAEDLDYVVFYEKPLVKFERILRTSLATFPRSWRTFGEAMITWFDEKLWIKSLLQERVGVQPSKILFTDHHEAHAASALFCSPYEKAAVLTVDGVGEWTTTATGWGTADWDGSGENKLVLEREIRFPHSLGLLYSAFTAWLGFRVNNGEYKVMGMAPYGKPRYQDRVYRLIDVESDGSFRLNLEYFSFHYSPERTFGAKFVELFGEPRERESRFFTPMTDPTADPNDSTVKRNQYYADVAASIQRVTEDILLKIANHLQRETGLRKLCMAGGVALNSVANGRLLQETEFEELWIQPAAGDAGGAVGAALYVWHIVLGQPRTYVMEHAYLGAAYADSRIVGVLDGSGATYETFHDDGALADHVVQHLIDGKVVGLFQGRFEWGPRALGNRSILADPRTPEMKNVVNEMIKFREPFRPFAPVVPEERASDLFELPDAERHYPARYMLMVQPWRDGAGAKAPACNHEGTGRLQTVRREWNPLYYDVVKGFGDATGVPVLMNTSFNLRGEPMVSSPEDALRTFGKSGLDVLVLGRQVVRKA